MIQQAGISEEIAKQIRTIELLNTASGGGARVYDMYVRVPGTGSTGVQTVQAVGQQNGTRKVLEQGRLIIIKNGERFTVLGQKL